LGRQNHGSGDDVKYHRKGQRRLKKGRKLALRRNAFDQYDQFKQSRVVKSLLEKKKQSQISRMEAKSRAEHEGTQQT
jgi:hypothetical protein